MAQPEISVVIPVYNAAAWLPRCVSSILAQTFEGFELLLVDDGSPDESGMICDKFAACDSRVRVLHKQNGGASSARNAGIAAAAGRYLCFVDADDEISPCLLQTALAAANAFPNDFILYSYTTARKELCAASTGEPPTAYAPAQIGRLYMNARLGAVWAMLFETEVLRRSGLVFDESLVMGEDLVFVFRYAHLLFRQRPGSGFQLLEEPLYFYDNDEKEGSLSRRLPADFCDCWCRVFEAILRENTVFFRMPERDEYAILHNYMRTIGVGLYAILTESGRSRAERKRAARAVLRSPAVRRLTEVFVTRHFYSPYVWPMRFCRLWPIRRLGRAQQREGGGAYYRLYWLGYAVHRRLHPGSPSL